MKFAAIRKDGRAYVIEAEAHVHGGPLVFDRNVMARVVAITPATKEDAEELITHLQETVKLMTLPKKGKKSTKQDRNSKMIEQFREEKEKD